MNKVCSTCLLEQPIDNFHRNSRKKDGHSYTCKLCMGEYHKKHYDDNKDAYKEQASSYKKKSKEYVIGVKKSSPCVMCGESRWYCLEFHHTDDNKEHNISDMVNNRHSIKSIQNEIDKCIVVCRNCHAEIHYNAGIT